MSMLRTSKLLCNGNGYVLSLSYSAIIIAVATDITIACRLGRRYGLMSRLVNSMSRVVWLKKNNFRWENVILKSNLGPML